MDTYTLLVFLHVVLFAYWLGADLGVHLAARFAIRSDLPFEERMRFLVLILLIDLGPETAITLMVPLGLTLAVMSGLAAVFCPRGCGDLGSRIPVAGGSLEAAPRRHPAAR